MRVRTVVSLTVTVGTTLSSAGCGPRDRDRRRGRMVAGPDVQAHVHARQNDGDCGRDGDDQTYRGPGKHPNSRSRYHPLVGFTAPVSSAETHEPLPVTGDVVAHFASIGVKHVSQSRSREPLPSAVRHVSMGSSRLTMSAGAVSLCSGGGRRGEGSDVNALARLAAPNGAATHRGAVGSCGDGVRADFHLRDSGGHAWPGRCFRV